MKFEIKRASGQEPNLKKAYQDADGDWFVDIDTLEELMSLCAEARDDLIVGPESIWIYDDRME